MRVAFLVADLRRSGGMAVVRDWARSIGDAVLVVCGDAAGAPPEADGVPVRPLAAMAGEPVDVAVATWWTTADALWDVPARRRVVLMQGFDARHYHDDEPADRLGALAVLDLPVAFVAVSRHLADVIEAVAPGAAVHVVAPGIDTAVFAPAPSRSGPGPLRVLVEGQPEIWFKGVAESIAAVRAMRAPATVTLVAPDPETANDAGADRVCGGLAPADMAALYASHDVLLKLSRFEGAPLTVLEALHVGRPCVVTPLGGGAGIVEHGVNGLVVGVDDAPGTTDALERLAADPALRARLGEGALATAARRPSQSAAAADFAAALEAILASEPPPLDAALARMARGRRRMIETLRAQEWRVREAAESWEAWRAAEARNADYDRWVRDLQGRIDALQRRPGFRLEERLRRLGRRA